jgi:two-component system response regulator VanR
VNRKILVVEDEKLLNDTISTFLTYSNYDVVSAYDGISAVEMAKQHNPDLILLDVMLPCMLGYDVAKAIRKFSSVPILFLTSIEDKESKQKAFEAGATDYLSKSIDLSVLVEKINQILK